MKMFWLNVAAATATALGASAAQATIFNFDLVYWEDTASPPANPTPDNVAHFVVDDQYGGLDYYRGNNVGIWTYGNDGNMFDWGFENAFIDIYDSSRGGGFTFIPYVVDDQGNEPDYDYMLDFGGPSVLGGTRGNYFIQTGVYDYDFDPGTLRVTITQAVQAAVPEPATWAMMLGGFGLMGAVMRQRKQATISFG